MTNQTTCLIYGANGFTGRLVAKHASAQGLRPVLAGRRAQSIEPLARQLRLPWRAFDLTDPASVRAGLADMRIVANCAGPFSATGAPMIDACEATGVHYLDITGEIDVFVAAQRRHDPARVAGVVICPGVGFDVMPTDCVAAVLRDALPDATHLALGFDLRGVPSPGTAKTLVEGLGSSGRIRRDGDIVEVPLGFRTRPIDFGEGEALGVTIPWGDIATAYFSTGIPNIETYIRASRSIIFAMRCFDVLRPVLGLRVVRVSLQKLAGRSRGPSEDQLNRDIGHVWGEVRNATGSVRSARLTVPNGYRLTADATVAAIKYLLEHAPAGGYYTPSQLMGPRCVEQLPGVSAIRIQ